MATIAPTPRREHGERDRSRDAVGARAELAARDSERRRKGADERGRTQPGAGRGAGERLAWRRPRSRARSAASRPRSCESEGGEKGKSIPTRSSPDDRSGRGRSCARCRRAPASPRRRTPPDPREARARADEPGTRRARRSGRSAWRMLAAVSPAGSTLTTTISGRSAAATSARPARAPGSRAGHKARQRESRNVSITTRPRSPRGRTRDRGHRGASMAGARRLARCPRDVSAQSRGRGRLLDGTGGVPHEHDRAGDRDEAERREQADHALRRTMNHAGRG